jgi:hypothetical protein
MHILNLRKMNPIEIREHQTRNPPFRPLLGFSFCPTAAVSASLHILNLKVRPPISNARTVGAANLNSEVRGQPSNDKRKCCDEYFYRVHLLLPIQGRIDAFLATSCKSGFPDHSFIH